MEIAQEYLMRAAECRQLSTMGPTPEICEHYRVLAELWDRLAKERVTFFVHKDKDQAKTPGS